MIKTERLLIRPLFSEDWSSMRSIAMDFRKSPYVFYDMLLPMEEQKTKALTQMFSDSQMFFAVMLNNVMIGYICFHEDNDNYDLGFCFHSDYHGRCYAYEACAAMLDYMEKERDVKVFTAGTYLRIHCPASCSISSDSF